MDKTKMPRKSAKEWTEILVPWIQVTGLIAAGVFALVAYRAKQQELREERAITYISRLYSDSLITARMKLSDREQQKAARFAETLGSRPGVSQDQINRAYYEFVADELIAHGKSESIEPYFFEVLGFLDDSVTCTKQKLCDEGAIRSGLFQLGHPFFRTYTPYLCFLRQLWKDDSLGREPEHFYNPVTKGDPCKAYYKSLGVTLGKSK